MTNKQNPENPENNIQEHYKKFREAIDQAIDAREKESKKRFKESLRYFLADGSNTNKVTDSKFFIEGVE